MSQFTRHRFAYAPLRDATRFPLKSQPIARAIDWHTNLEGRAAAWFDALSMITFALIGIAMTWYSRSWIPGAWWQLSGSTDPILLSAVRIAVALAGGLSVFALIMIGARLGLSEIPGDHRTLAAAKFAVAALLGVGTLMMYRDPVIGLIPVVGLSMLALILLFRIEPSDAFKASLAIALVTIPCMQTLALI